MKTHQPYEPYIHNRLAELNAPNHDQLWSSMKEILDREMPEKKNKKRFFWWMFTSQSLAVLGGMAAVSTAVVYHYQKAGGSADKPVSPVADKALAAPRLSTPAAERPPKAESPGGAGAARMAASLSMAARADDAPARSALTNAPPGSPQATLAVASRSENPITTTTTQTLTDQTSTQPTTITLNEDIRSTYKKLQHSERKPWDLSQRGLIGHRSVEQRASANAAPLIRPDRSGWVAGISFNVHLPVGQQQMSGASLNGGPSRAFDYIPSAYLQYHLNNRVSVQTEVQLVAPQYTPGHTLDVRTKTLSNERQEQTIRLNKLYYMNIPFTVHYSPLPHLRLGTGIQYSYLRRSVLTEERVNYRGADNLWHKTSEEKEIHVRSNPDVERRQYARNPGAAAGMTLVDTVAQSLRGNDWRLVMDANYEWKRLNGGVRVNMGLTNYLKDAAGAATLNDRHESLQLYLRYNLWERGTGRKR